jgi:2-dehydro-3-deoxygalactonokinase
MPVLLSGMASSSIGMIELPYKELPFKVDGSDIDHRMIPASAQFSHDLFIISGARTSDDVLRGEETMLIGSDYEGNDMERVFIFPGTHSKHIYVHKGVATHFKTYITGELFNLLASKSILSNSVEKGEDDNGDTIDAYFERGVIEGASTNLLNSVFHVRTNQLFRKNDAFQNYQYLSGLLIGGELKDMLPQHQHEIILVSGKGLGKPYRQALEVLGHLTKVRYEDADVALVKGQWRIYQKIENPLRP